MTAYQYALNNPIMLNDPMGDLAKGTTVYDIINTITSISRFGGTWHSGDSYVGTFASNEDAINAAKANFGSFAFWESSPSGELVVAGGVSNKAWGYSNNFALREVSIVEAKTNRNWLIDRQKEAYRATYNSLGNNANQGESVGQPGFGESLIPVWGSGRAAIDDFQNGHYGGAAFNTALAISDVFLVKALATGIAKGGVKMLSKSYTYWSSARKFYGKEGFAEAGQQLHHWAWARNGAIKGEGVAWWAKNQMWNLMPMESQAIHTAVHGMGPNAFNGLERLYYGTPQWFKSGLFGTGGDVVNQFK